MSTKKIVTAENVEKTNNDRIKGTLMRNKMAMQKAKCSICVSRKPTILKQKSTLKMLKSKTFR